MQNEESTPSCGLKFQSTAIQHDVTAKASEALGNKGLSENTDHFHQDTFAHSQGLILGRRTSFRTFSRHMALLTVLFTSVKKKKKEERKKVDMYRNAKLNHTAVSTYSIYKVTLYA